MEGHVALLLKTGLPIADALAVTEAVASELDSIYELQEDDPVQFSIQRTPKGPAIFLEDCADLDQVLQYLSAALTARGHGDATVTTVPIVRPYHGHGLATEAIDEMGSVNGYLSLRGVPKPHGPYLTGWDVARVDADDALRSLLDWAFALPGVEPDADVCTGKYFTRVALEDVSTIMQARMRNMDLLTLQTNCVITYAGHSFREVKVLPAKGVAEVAEGSEVAAEFDWHTSFTGVRRPLAHSGAWCTYGHLTRGFDCGTVAWGRPDHPTRRCDEQWTYINMQARLFLEQGFLSDVYGVFRLPNHLADRLLLRPTWNTEPATEPGFTIATHTTPSAWFEHPDLDPTTFDQARGQLGQHLVPRDKPDHNAWQATLQLRERYKREGLRSATYWERGR